MLNKNPEERVSIRGIMDHPWVSDYREAKVKKFLEGYEYLDLE